MVLLVNRSSGGPMWVHEDRVEEYLAAGHRLAAPPKPAKPLIRQEAEESAQKPKKAKTKK